MIDYSEVIQKIAKIKEIAIPIGLILSLSEWAVTFFIKCALGKIGHNHKGEY